MVRATTVGARFLPGEGRLPTDWERAWVSCCRGLLERPPWKWLGCLGVLWGGRVGIGEAGAVGSKLNGVCGITGQLQEE